MKVDGKKSGLVAQDFMLNAGESGMLVLGVLEECRTRASYKFDHIENLDFSRCELKHPRHAYVGDFASEVVEILLPAVA